MPPPPPKPAAKPAGKKRGKGEPEAAPVVEESPTIVPADQCKLSAKQLEEDMTRVLTATNPHTAHNPVSYNYAERAYKAVPPLAEDEVFFHFRQMARTMHKGSDEYAAQADYDKNFRETVQDKRRQRQEAAQEEGKTLSQAELEEDDTQRNQFNFTERAAQTYNPTTKARTVSTTPPDSTNSTGLMTQWGLYDAYVQEYERLMVIVNMEKNAKDSKKASAARSAAGAPEEKDKGKEDPMHTPEMAARMRVMERIVNQVRGGEGGRRRRRRERPRAPLPLTPRCPPPRRLASPPPARTPRTRSTPTSSTGRTRATSRGSTTRAACCRCGALRTRAPSARW